MIRHVCFIIILLLTGNLYAYDILHYSDMFIDQSRSNRQIPVEIYYPSADSFLSFPVLVFGHGWLMSYGVYQQLARDLCSHGFIIVFPTSEGGLFPNHNNFGMDINFVGQMILRENTDENSNLYNIVDSTFIAMGHSMGGGCSVLASSGNSFFAGLITFAAAETNPSAITASINVTCPSLTFSADDDWIAPPETNQIPIYDNLSSSLKYYINIFNESHTGLTSNSIVPLIVLNRLFIRIPQTVLLVSNIT
jgi:dienelactone hydrolase